MLYNIEQVEAICNFIERGHLAPNLGLYHKAMLREYPEDTEVILEDTELLSWYFQFGIPYEGTHSSTMEALEVYVMWYKSLCWDNMKSNDREQFQFYLEWVREVIEG